MGMEDLRHRSSQVLGAFFFFFLLFFFTNLNYRYITFTGTITTAITGPATSLTTAPAVSATAVAPAAAGGA